MNETFRGFLDSLLVTSDQRLQDLGFLSFGLLLILSAASAIAISYFYIHFYSSRATGSQLYLVFPLLGVSVTAIFLCIQFSLPLSLGLLGALSIVRFRTPIKEPEEIGFIMLVIAASLACATFNVSGLLAVLAVALLVLAGRRFAPGILRGPAEDGSLILGLPEERYREKSADLFAFLEADFRRLRLESISKTGDEVFVTFHFKSVRPQQMRTLEEGLREIVDPAHLTLLYNRPGAL